MLDSEGFDLWADGYEQSVGLSDDDGSYPFAGYGRVLDRIRRRVLERGAPAVLDIGFGTAALTAGLYARGCGIWGQDFSARMIDLARAKMPSAHLYRGDFSRGLHPALVARRYDFIIATYALHHLEDGQKVRFIRSLLPLLKPGGQVLIGDVAFPDRPALERCRAAYSDEWDDEEHYFVFDELRGAFPGMSFEPVSHCAGVFTINP